MRANSLYVFHWWHLILILNIETLHSLFRKFRRMRRNSLLCRYNFIKCLRSGVSTFLDRAVCVACCKFLSLKVLISTHIFSNLGERRNGVSLREIENLHFTEVLNPSGRFQGGSTKGVQLAFTSDFNRTTLFNFSLWQMMSYQVSNWSAPMTTLERGWAKI